MFDMLNFGDLMFPVVAAHELGLRGYQVQALSPTGATINLKQAVPSRPVWSALDPGRSFAGILIGGGYIVHTHRMDTMMEYRGQGIGAAVAPSVWLGSTLAAALRDVPIAWNAPGVPHPLRPRVEVLAAAAFAAADYLSLRDAGSARMANVPTATIVPDPILGLDRVWPRDGLVDDFFRLCAQLGLDRQDRILAVHVRQRSLGGEPIPSFVNGLAAACRSLDLTPVLIGLGTAHADDRIARELAATLRDRGVWAVALDRPEGLRDVAALLAHARAYVGSSLHGYIAATAYGVPGLLVARPAYRKFDGLVAHLERPQDLLNNWDAALAALPRALAAPSPALPKATSEQLRYHWDNIAAAFAAGPTPNRPARLRFAALAFNTGLERDGPNWAIAPFTTAKERAAALDGADVREMEPF
ncbi:hypothetical protein BOO69_14155 [Sulfitobacter alexandrii]|uniref:Polysaccharide pyruvyl transferase domain-containing protein n=1 Tax=Sulfitobacter alexandrii TaxID=1917485 RepID=A0A1J0WJC9_9RHOB|nr:hypothetical protein BOO69_14155 [Sulfitobacter alexandrii]